MKRYEQRVIKPILNIIQKHQDYLCKPENLPQLAKLGFMFEKFWYAGRLAYGYKGYLENSNQCENNPKYELTDNIQYNSNENDNLVYDAWGMHVSNDGNEMHFNEIKDLILNGKPITEIQKLERKLNKTFDEWVEVLTHKDYQYNSLFPDRRSVANYLLCVFGTGFGYDPKNGVIFKEASGADQDIALYGDWENAKFKPEILKIVKRILDIPELEKAIEAEIEYRNIKMAEIKRKEIEEREEWYTVLLTKMNEVKKEDNLEPFKSIYDEDFINAVEKYKELSYKKYMKDLGDKKEKYNYYPISNGYSIITKLGKKTHPSYIEAALEICKHIKQNPPEIKPDYNQYQKDNVKEQIEFAENFIKKFDKNLEVTN